MNSNIYFIIGGIAIAFVIYIIILQTIMKKRKQQQLANFGNSHSGSSLTDEQKRLLVFGAILSYHRGEKILNIMPENLLDTYIYGLKQQWEISNSNEAKETLNQLLELEKSNDFDAFFEQSSEDLLKIKKEIAKGLDIQISEVENVNSTYAWDICRAVALTKWCYWCGYLTEDEAWSIMREASEIANQHGKNWTDYTVSFLLGRTMQGFDLEDLIIESNQILHSKSPSLRKIEDIDVYKRYRFNL